ncbi:hypothetical protein [Thiobacillus sp.]
MNKQDERLDRLADRLAEEALHELGDVPLDEADDYSRQCDYAGCYPWLPDVIDAHPHDPRLRTALRGRDAADEGFEFPVW